MYEQQYEKENINKKLYIRSLKIKKENEQKGITLIALVVTIILLLILASKNANKTSMTSKINIQ